MDPRYTPLAERLRPKVLKDIIGQEHLTNSGGLLAQLVATKQPTSLILWGPPGSGKTTIARILGDAWDAECIELSAVTAGLKDVRAVVEQAQANRRLGQRTVLFVDEVHRFNKKQQDAFLPHVESGVLTLVGATTENPSFEVNNALLSRSRVVILNPLSEDALIKLAKKAAIAAHRKIPAKSSRLLAQLSGGDGRTIINTIELAAQFTKGGEAITPEHIKTVLQRANYQFDKSGDDHYNLASAFIKSMRGSDEEASLYYLYRLIAGGEDPLFLARRLIIFASEDIGMAAPYALTLAVATFQAVERVGMPESEYTLTHATVALARSPKSREVPELMHTAKQQVATHPNAPVPLHVRNAPTQLMKDLGYNANYKWQADFKPPQGFMPEALSKNTQKPK